jgi:6-phosphofructokinase 1
MATRRIGILTGGGDVPGLNSVIKSVTWRGIENGLTVLGIRRGWEGLTHVNLDDPQSRARYLQPLTRDNTRTIDRSGGTVLHTSRVSPSRIRDLPPHLAGRDFPVTRLERDGAVVEYRDLGGQVRRNLEALGLTQLVVIGGDGTLAFASELAGTGFGVVAIPKTMDNDVRGTEYCVGFSTAITRAMAAIERQRTTVGSHERVGVFRVFGRDSGFTALYTALVTSNRCVIPEYPVDLGRLIDLLMEEKRQNPSNYVLVVLSEGARWHGYAPAEYGPPDEHGRRKKVNVGEALSDEIKRGTGEETIVSDLTYDLRSGEPDFIDKLVAQTYGTMALDALLEGRSGLMSAMVNGCYQLVPIPDPALGPRRVDVESLYNTERYRPLYGDKRGLPVFLTRW